MLQLVWCVLRQWCLHTVIWLNSAKWSRISHVYKLSSTHWHTTTKRKPASTQRCWKHKKLMKSVENVQTQHGHASGGTALMTAARKSSMSRWASPLQLVDHIQTQNTGMRTTIPHWLIYTLFHRVSNRSAGMISSRHFYANSVEFAVFSKC